MYNERSHLMLIIWMKLMKLVIISRRETDNTIGWHKCSFFAQHRSIHLAATFVIHQQLLHRYQRSLFVESFCLPNDTGRRVNSVTSINVWTMSSVRIWLTRKKYEHFQLKQQQQQQNTINNKWFRRNYQIRCWRDC